MRALPVSAVQYLGATPIMSISEGMVHFEPQDGCPPYVMPLSVFRAAHRRAGAMLAIYDANAGNVVSLKAPRD